MRLDPKLPAAYLGAATPGTHSSSSTRRSAISAKPSGLRQGRTFTWLGPGPARRGNYDQASSDPRSAVAAVVPADVRSNCVARSPATCPSDKHRDGKQAVELGWKTIERFSQPSADQLDTLAAAYAETGDFASAVQAETEAIALSDIDATTLAAMQARLMLFKQQKPYRAE